MPPKSRLVRAIGRAPLAVATLLLLACGPLAACSNEPANADGVALVTVDAAIGSFADGAVSDGIASDSVASDGVGSDSVASDGVGSDSVASDGVGSDSVASDSAVDDAAVDDAAVDDAAIDDAAGDGSETDDGSDDTDVSESDAASADVGADVADEDAVDAGPSCPLGCVLCGDAGQCLDLQPCVPALTISPVLVTTLPYALTTFAAKGGTGAYGFKLKKDASGALLNPYAGTYLSGDKTGTKDRIELSDTGCLGSAEATVTVVDPIDITPLSAEVAPGESFTFNVANGSGSFGFKLLLAPSGGKIVAKTGYYTAGNKPGDDVVEISDSKTGETSTAKVLVRVGAVITSNPGALLMPIGGRAKLEVQGGSGQFSLLVGGIAVKSDGPLSVVATAAGSSLLTIQDNFLGKTFTVQTTVIATLTQGDGPVGDGTQQSTLVSAGDLDGDGLPELMLGQPESDLGAYNAGAVFIWRSNATGGVTPEPWTYFVGGDRETRLGWSLAAADLDGDGKNEILVGAPLDDVGTVNNGAIHVYKTQPSGKPKLKPSATLAGRFSSDQAGSAVAVCDFNGDGVLDVAVGAPYAEDRDASPVVSDTGGAYVWLGGKAGLAALTGKPSFARYGAVPDGKGGWQSVASMRVGWSVAAGDFDGDGACDLAVGSLYYNGGHANDGLVLVYRGEKSSADSSGGLSALPARVFSGASLGEVGSQFGRSMAACDVDGDKKAELVVGELAFRGGDAKMANRGATRLFKLASLAKAATKIEGVDAAAWSAVGAKGGDYHGYRVNCFDADGDGLSDVVSQIYNGEIEGGAVNAGVLAIYAGVKGALPADAPIRSLSGNQSGTGLGLASTPLADLDGDGKPEIAAFASVDSSLGYYLGRTYVFTSKGALATADVASGLSRPTVASGGRYGSALAFVGDLDGDGYEELAVGASYASPAIAGKYVALRAGTMWVLPGTKSGVNEKGAQALVGFVGHSGSDLLGWAVDGAGDFDGDGNRDVVALARSEDRPANFSSAYIAVGGCGNAANNVSAAYVFRGVSGALPGALPAFVGYGPQANKSAETILGDLDVDGDGKRDIIMGSPSWDGVGRNNAGGWALYRGRALVNGKIKVACAPDYVAYGDAASDAMGRSLTRVGDIDGDGCDEFAVGASGADNGLSNQGAVHIIFGWGKACKSTMPRSFALRSEVANAALGYGVAGGYDVDGDGKNDLAVGAINYSAAGKTVGAVWLVRGAWLAQQKPTPVVDGKAPEVIVALADVKESAILGVHGVAVNGRFGWALAMVPAYEPDGRAAVLVGAPLAAVGGTALAGGAELLRFSKAAGLVASPAVGVVGDSARPGASSGIAVAARKASPGAGTRPVLAVGSIYGTPVGDTSLDQGDVLVAPCP